MKANDVFMNSRVAHVRELKSEISALKADLASTRTELSELRSHFDFAVRAAVDATALGEDGECVIVDGCNQLLAAGRRGELAPGAEFRERRTALVEQVRGEFAGRNDVLAWVVFDGPVESSVAEGNLRVSYTGGEGAQRADRHIVDFLHALRLGGAKTKVVVITADNKLAEECERMGAECRERL